MQLELHQRLLADVAKIHRQAAITREDVDLDRCARHRRDGLDTFGPASLHYALMRQLGCAPDPFREELGRNAAKNLVLVLAEEALTAGVDIDKPPLAIERVKSLTNAFENFAWSNADRRGQGRTQNDGIRRRQFDIGQSPPPSSRQSGPTLAGPTIA